MKHHVSIAMLTIMFLMAFSAGAELSTPIKILESENQVEVTDLYSTLPPFTRIFRSGITKSPKNISDDEPIYRVRVNFEYDPEKYAPAIVNIVNRNYRNIGYIREDNFCDISVPAETYDIFCEFRNLNVDPNSPTPPMSIVIIENVDVSSDTEVIANAATATNLIEFKSYNPDGSLSVLPLKNDNSGATVEIMYSDTYLMNKKFGWVYGIHILDFYIESSQYPDRLRNILVNDLSDSYSISQIRVLFPISDKPEMAYIKMTTSEIKNVSLSNDPADYLKIESSNFEKLFVNSPSYSEFDREYDYNWHINSVNFTDNMISGGITSLATKMPELYFDSPFASESPLLNEMVSIKHLENYQEDPANWQPINQGIVGPYIMQQDDHFVFTIEPFIGKRGDEAFQAGINCFWDGEFNPYVKTTFSFDDVVFGTSTSWAFFTTNEVDYSETFGIDNRTLHGTLIDYIGRYGEVRDIDDAIMTIDIYYNGEKIRSFTNFDSLMQWSFEWLMSGEELGELKYVITNENIEVEGLKGKNYIEAVLDERNKECTIPTLQYLGFEDSDGKYTNSFKTGKINLFAGDFDIVMRDNWETSPKPSYYSVFSPLKSMKVEYASYGSDNFTELNVEMIPGAVWHPFGQYYSAEIAGLSDGWYDVRVTMEDEAGNWQKQTVSPAFKILDSSSVDTTTYGPETTPTYYNMQGVRVDKPENGIFIERTGNSVCKVVK